MLSNLHADQSSASPTPCGNLPPRQFANGSILTTFSAEEPDRLRGPQHAYLWSDEMAAWQHAAETWSNALLGLRIGLRPRAVVTTTPRPVPLLRQLIADPGVKVVRGRTADNARNLSAAFLTEVTARYGGTRLGRQELDGELIEDVEGALWQRSWLDVARVALAPELTFTVVAVDPAVSVSESSDETGIIAAGRDAAGEVFVLADRSSRAAGRTAARRAWAAFLDYRADQLVYESNQGADWVRQILADAWAELQREGAVPATSSAPLRAVHASHGKRLRAEPIAARYEAGRVHHVGELPELESQLTGWVPESGQSPDRLDALVHAATALANVTAPAVLSSPVGLRIDRGRSAGRGRAMPSMEELLAGGSLWRR